MAFPRLIELATRSSKAVARCSFGCLFSASLLMGAGAIAADSSVDAASYTASPKDPLLTPAIKSPLAERSFILDVTQAGDRLVAVGERGHILYSDDQGASWTQADVPVSVTLTSVSFPVPEQGWAVGHQGVILHSSDSGQTWQLQFDGMKAGKLWIEFAEENFAKAEAQLVEGDMESEEIWDLADLALGDAEASIEFGPAQPLLDVWFRNAKEGFVVGSYGDIFHTVNGGEKWQVHRRTINNPNNFHYYSIEQAPSGLLYIVGERGGIYRSRDVGRSWTQLDSPYLEGSFYRSLAFEYEGQEVVMLLGFGGHLYRSVDEGESWEKIETPTTKSINDGAVLADGSIVLVGLNGTLLHSTDGGQSFTAKFDSRGFPYTSVLALGDKRVMVTGAIGAEVVAVTDGEERTQ